MAPEIETLDPAWMLTRSTYVPGEASGFAKFQLLAEVWLECQPVA